MPGLTGDEYSTRVGEQRTVALEDGSKLTLNTDTALTVRFTRDERRVRLTDGQAYFRVAHDAKRPFIVDTGMGTVRAIGTEFDVYRTDGSVTVTLVEGRVLVNEGSTAAPGGIALEAGQRIALGGTQVTPRAEPVAVEKLTAWLSGRVVFDNEPLGDAVMELNRYSRSRIVVGDEGTRSLRITGVFLIDRNEAFVRAVEASFPVAASKDAGGRYVLKARGEITRRERTP